MLWHRKEGDGDNAPDDRIEGFYMDGYLLGGWGRLWIHDI
jgi:hypothetical protein